MTSTEKTIKKFIQEILKTEGLVAADQLSALAVDVFGEEGEAFYIRAEKKEELNALLRELNQETHAARIAYESGQKKAEGYKMIIKPFTDIFNYLSENIHERRAKELALEATQLFLQASVTQLIEEAISTTTVNKIKDMALRTMADNKFEIKNVGSNMTHSRSMKDKAMSAVEKGASKVKDADSNVAHAGSKAKDKVVNTVEKGVSKAKSTASNIAHAGSKAKDKAVHTIEKGISNKKKHATA